MKHNPWRGATFALVGFVAASIVTWTYLWQVNVSRLDNLAAEWTSLFEVCRTSVELDTPFLTVARQSVSTGPSKASFVADPVSGSALAMGRFVVRDLSSGDEENFRRSCEVGLLDERDILDRDEIGILVVTFSEIRADLYSAQTHEFLSTDLLPPSTMLAFGLRQPNAAGCSTIAYVSFDASVRAFSTRIGEQTTHRCQRPVGRT